MTEGSHRMADTLPSAPPPSVPPPASTTPLPLVTPVRVVCTVLLLAPFAALLWVNSYARTSPAFIGIPFFYWYQLLWVIVSAVFTGVAYLLIRREEARRRARPSGSGEVG
jgi:membrane protein implicated in regulation of membrane protease activity